MTFDYAGARAQARHGQRLSEAQWERLARTQDFPLYLQSARETALQPWVANLDAAVRPHVIEAALRAQFRARVRAVASWAPAPWRAALLWIGTLPDVPVAGHVAAEDKAYDWISADPVLAAAGPAQHRRGRALVAAWLARWRELWPDDAGARVALEQLARKLEAVARGAIDLDADATRAKIEPVLRRAFRRHTRAPAGLVASLALSWLELVRLRGALLRRRFTLPMELAAPDTSTRGQA